MSKWLPSSAPWPPGMIRPGLVTPDQVFLAAKTAIAAGLAWVAAFKKVMFGEPEDGAGGPRGAAGAVLPNPVNSPQPAIETIDPVIVTEGSPSLTLTIKQTALAAKVPVVGVYETMPTGYDYQSWMLAEVAAIEKAITHHRSTEKL